MKYFFTIVFILQFTFSPSYAQWLRYTIDENLPSAMGLDIADIDKDGDLDVIATSEHEYDIFWYENTNLTWKKHVVETNLGGVIFVYAYDLDGDDDLDLVANGFKPPIIVWYENENFSWTKHVIDDTLEGCEYIEVADMDNDNDYDVLVTTFADGSVFWYENNNVTWTRDTIDTSLQKTNTVNPGDIDGDSFLDVVVTDKDANDLLWYKNNDAGTSWTKAIIDTNLSEAFAFFVADIDEDSKPDVFGTAKGIGEVVWYKNNLPSEKWTKYTIDADLPDAHCPRIADMDSDGDPDVVVTAGAMSVVAADKVIWYENNLPDPNWPAHLIDGILDAPRICDVADFNADTKPDLVVTGYFAQKLVWYHNVIDVAHAYSVECSPTYIKPQGDDLVINARIANPDIHLLDVHAIIHGEQSAFLDSIQLYDDGQHNDSLASDNIWGNSKWLSDLSGDTYQIEVSVYDLTDDRLEILYPATMFTTFGPVTLEDCNITSSDTIVNPGDYLKFEFTLKNWDPVKTLPSVTTKLALIDTFTSLRALAEIAFGEIPPNQTVTGSTKQYIQFSDYCYNGQIIKMPIDIYSQGVHFWTDSLVVVDISTDEPVLPAEFALHQNYPNPFNPRTVISYQIPAVSEVDLSIYDILGQKVATLVSTRQPLGTYKVEWDASGFASGVYLYKLETEDFQETKKVILIK